MIMTMMPIQILATMAMKKIMGREVIIVDVHRYRSNIRLQYKPASILLP